MKIIENFILVVTIGFMIFYISYNQTRAQAIDTIYSADEIFAIEVLKNSPGNILLIATYTCVSKSTDFGASWSISNFDTIPGCSDISFNAENNNIGFLATGAALSKTTDGGINWLYTTQLDYTFFVDVNPYFPNIIFVWGNEDIGLGPFHFYLSEDGGITWQDSTGELIVLKPQFHSDSSHIVFAHNSTEILRTTDTGKTWSTILSYENNLWIEALILNPGDPDILYSGGDGILYKTTNGGLDWDRIDSALITLDPDFYISSILVDERTAGRLYVGLRQYGNAETGLFLTEDDGKSWKQIYDEAINIIEADNESPRNIYCATNFGAIRLLDTFTVTGVNEFNNLLPERFYLFQNYPNPFNPSTKIKFTIPTHLNPPFNKGGKTVEFVTLKVYDVLGNEVATLVNEEQPIGSYEIEFDGTEFTSGVYIYQLKAGNFLGTRKMVLLK